MVEIQTIYTFIQNVEPSTLISDLQRDTLVRLLPVAIRSCLRAYNIARKWLISRIVEPRIGLRSRQMRIDTMLQALEIARLRSTNGNTEGQPQSERIDQPCVRSFVETVLTSALLSCESRAHSRAWQNISYQRGSPCDSLASVLSKRSTGPLQSAEPLTVDMGWILERLLDIISTNHMASASEPSVNDDASSLVHFDKRR